jgi:hypothetical protein
MEKVLQPNPCTRVKLSDSTYLVLFLFFCFFLLFFLFFRAVLCKALRAAHRVTAPQLRTACLFYNPTKMCRVTPPNSGVALLFTRVPVASYLGL